MKLEKLNENQIRCTLNSEDLAKRQLRVSELAYGSEKAKSLFRELMKQAKGELDFDAEDIPLMIEAIPVSPECLVLVMTKVDDPDELDTRFSNFTEDPDRDEIEYEDTETSVCADEILSSFEHIASLIGEAITASAEGKSEAELTEQVAIPAIVEAMSRVYSFESLDTISELARVLVPFYEGHNSVYKDSASGRYYLIVSMSKQSPVDFNKVCNILSEYGTYEKNSYARLSYFEEHCEAIVMNNALQVFAKF